MSGHSRNDGSQEFNFFIQEDVANTVVSAAWHAGSSRHALWAQHFVFGLKKGTGLSGDVAIYPSTQHYVLHGRTIALPMHVATSLLQVSNQP